MPAVDPSTAALRRTVERRMRLEETLRLTLGSQREQYARLEAARDAKRAALQAQRDILQACHARIASMMSDGKPFSLADMNGSMRYAEIVAQRVGTCEGELATAEHALSAKEDEIAAAIRAIANNRGRIDVCHERIAHIGRARANAADDAADEEAEEAVLARMAQAREQPTTRDQPRR